MATPRENEPRGKSPYSLTRTHHVPKLPAHRLVDIHYVLNESIITSRAGATLLHEPVPTIVLVSGWAPLFTRQRNHLLALAVTDSHVVLKREDVSKREARPSSARQPVATAGTDTDDVEVPEPPKEGAAEPSVALVL